MLLTAKQLLQKAKQTTNDAAKVEYLTEAINALMKVVENHDSTIQGGRCLASTTTKGSRSDRL